MKVRSHTALLFPIALLVLSFSFAPHAFAKQIFLVSNPGVIQTWQVPPDYNPIGATFECIGPGGSSAAAVSNSRGSDGGGGGAYAEVFGLALTPLANISYQVGESATSSAGNNVLNSTFFDGTTPSGSLLNCDGGQGGRIVNTAPTGGQVSASIGTIKYAGGSGATFSVCSGICAGGGGGGAAGPHGVGRIGGVTTNGRGGGGGGGSDGNLATNGIAPSTAVGGAGGISSKGNAGGLGGTASADATSGTNGSGGGGGGSLSTNTGNGGAGSCDTCWDATHGSCSGGGGGSDAGTTVAPGAAGTYGGGAGGAGETASVSGAGVSGGQGIIVITYNPIAPSLAGIVSSMLHLLGGGVRIVGGHVVVQ